MVSFHTLSSRPLRTAHVALHLHGLFAGMIGAGYIALTGDLPGALLAFKTNYPLLAVPVKLTIAYPLAYHYLGSLRHFAWDHWKIGNQTDQRDLLETPRVEMASKVLIGSSVALSLIIAFM